MNYDRLAATSLRLLTKNGQDVTRRAYASGAYNPSTGESVQTTSDTTRKGVLLDFDSGKTTERGELVQVADKRLLLDAQGPVQQQDHFIVGTDEYTVVSIGEINPAGTPVLYDLHLRRG